MKDNPGVLSSSIIYIEFVNSKGLRCIISVCDKDRYVLTLGEDLVYYVYRESLDVVVPMLKSVLEGMRVSQTPRAIEKTRYDNQCH